MASEGVSLDSFFATDHVRFGFLREPVAVVVFEEPKQTSGSCSLTRPKGLDLRSFSTTVQKMEDEEEIDFPEPPDRKCWPWTSATSEICFRSMILAQAAGKDTQAAHAELQRWYASFSQTYFYEKDTPRTATYSTSDQKPFHDPVKIVTHVGTSPMPDDYESTRFTEALRNKLNDSDEAPVARSAPLSTKDSVTAEQAEELSVPQKLLSEIFDSHGALKNPELQMVLDPWGGGDDDKPGPSYPQTLAPFDSAKSQYRLREIGGSEQFITWLWLLRRRMTPAEHELWVKQVGKVVADKQPEYAQACVVPVAMLKWKASYNLDFEYKDANPDVAKPKCSYSKDNLSIQFLPSGGAAPARGHNWIELSPVKRQMYYAMPKGDSSQTFPDLRIIDVAEQMYHIVNNVPGQQPAELARFQDGSENGAFDLTDKARIEKRENEIQAAHTIFSDDIQDEINKPKKKKKEESGVDH